MQTDYLQFIFQAITNLLTQNLGFFDAMGQNLFRMFATILIVWFGVKSALAASSGRGGFHFENFASSFVDHQFWICDGQLLQQSDPRHRDQFP